MEEKEEGEDRKPYKQTSSTDPMTYPFNPLPRTNFIYFASQQISFVSAAWEWLNMGDGMNGCWYGAKYSPEKPSLSFMTAAIHKTCGAFSPLKLKHASMRDFSTK